MRLEVVIDQVTHLRLGAIAAARGIPPERIAAGFLASAVAYGEKKKPRKSRKPISEETREKLRRSHRGHQHTPVTRQKMAAAALGHTVSDETREKLRRYQLLHPGPSRFQPGHPPMGHAVSKSGR